MNQIEGKCKKLLSISAVACLLILTFWGSTLGGYGMALLLGNIGIAGLGYGLFSVNGSDILGSMQAKRRKKEQYRNVIVLRRNTALWMVFLALLMTLGQCLLAQNMAEQLLGLPLAVSTLRRMSPIYVLFALHTVLFAYFKGIGQYFPSFLEAVLRPVGYLVLGGGLLKSKAEYSVKVGQLLNAPEKGTIYTVNAIITGVILTELIILGITFVLYLRSDPQRDKLRAHDGAKLSEGMVDSIRNYFSMIIYSLLGTLMVVLPMVLGLKSMFAPKEIETVTANGGFLFAAFSLPMAAVFLSISKAAEFSVRMGKIKRVKDIRKLKRVMEVTGCYAFRIGLFFSMIFMVLADSIVKAVYSWTTGVQVPAVVITILSILPIVVSVVCLTQINVQGKRSVGMLMLLVTLIVAVLLMLFLPVKMASSQIGFALAFTIAAFLLMLLSFGYVFLQQFYSVNLPFIMGLPLIVSMVMGLVLTIIVKLLSPHIGEPVSLVISMILGSLMYFGTLTAARNVTSHDIQFLYGDKIQKLFGLFIK